MRGYIFRHFWRLRDSSSAFRAYAELQSLIKATCALTAIANLGTQAKQSLSEAQVVQRAIDNNQLRSDVYHGVSNGGASAYFWRLTA